ncbi:hypothetical protein N2152v2_010567 [Parachlorella kessleri]
MQCSDAGRTCAASWLRGAALASAINYWLLRLAFAISTESAVVSQKYTEWAAAAGIQSRSVAQAQFGELRGAKALEDIPPNQPFITLPRSAALVVTPQQKCPYDSVDPTYWKNAPCLVANIIQPAALWPTPVRYLKMSILLLMERRKGSTSAVWGYIQQLPDSIDSPVRWSDEEVQQLQYRPVIAQLQQQKQKWREQYDGLVAALTARGGPSVAWEEFLWAMENVRSRSFSGPYTGASFREKLTTGGVVLAAGSAYALWAHLPLQQALNGLLAALMFNIIYDVLISQKLKWHAMCPVIDAINHSSSVESDVFFEYFRDSFTLSCSAPFKAGQQVFISYGPQGNDSLLQFYGFLERPNPHDTYSLEVPAGRGKTVKVTVNAKGGVEAESLAVLTAAVAEAGGSTQASKETVWKELANACEQELARLPTSAADDERLLQTPHLLSPRTRLAVEFRLEKKRLLERCLAKVDKRAKKRAAKAGSATTSAAAA